MFEKTLPFEPLDAWVIGRLLCFHDGDLEKKRRDISDVSPSWLELAVLLGSSEYHQRQRVFGEFIKGRFDGDMMVYALANVDPYSPRPKRYEQLVEAVF